jgi:hypothetical protein
MGLLEQLLPRNDCHAALLLYGMVLAVCFIGYDAGICSISKNLGIALTTQGIMTVILAHERTIECYHVDTD